MNKQREKAIQKIMCSINAAIDAKNYSLMMLDQLRMDINSILYDEQAAYDNIPESLQLTDRAMRSEECIECLEDAVSMLDSDEDSLLAAYDCLEEICNG